MYLSVYSRMLDAGRGGLGDDAVVHVGEVHHLDDLEAARAQEAAQDVLEDEGAEIADVGEVVDRGTAGVDAHLARVQRHKGLFAPVRAYFERRFRPLLPGHAPLVPVHSLLICFDGSDFRARRATDCSTCVHAHAADVAFYPTTA